MYINFILEYTQIHTHHFNMKRLEVGEECTLIRRGLKFEDTAPNVKYLTCVGHQVLILGVRAEDI